MYTSSLFLAVLVGIAQAQTPEGFVPAVSIKLDLLYNSTTIQAPGQQLSKSATAQAPQIGLPSTLTSPEAAYIYMMLDLDVPAAALNGTNSMPPADPNARLTLLHALTTDLTPTTQRLLSSLSPTNGANGTADSVLLTTPTVEQSPAAYLGPSPPNTDTTPHRYVSLVFEQPASGLQIEAGAFDDIQARIGFDVQAFMQENGLSEPLAGNFFVVDGMNPESGAGFNGSATGTGGIGGPTGQPRLFEGTAAATEAALGLAAGFAMMVGLVV